jgi:hypothetical protein
MEKNYVDEVMCFMQGASKEAAIVRLGPGVNADGSGRVMHSETGEAPLRTW